MNAITLVPARMGSSRFPGKPLALINGTPMIELVYNNVKSSAIVSQTYVATCDDVIADHMRSLGANVVMTSDRHERASDRCAEACEIIESELKQKFDVVVMVQGDEPMITSSMVDEALAPFLSGTGLDVVNLMASIKSESDFLDRNTIKVVVDRNDDAIYFSRSAIPCGQNVDNCWKQVCVIPFRRHYLTTYNALEPTPLEVRESIDMLRVIENGGKVRMVKTQNQTQAVDTPADLRRVEELLAEKL